MSEVGKKILSLIEEELEIDRDELIIKSNMDMQGLGINSIRFIKVVVRIEQEFNIEIDDEFLNSNNFNNLREFIDFIEKNVDRVQQ